jgi:hypothetical protein
MLMRSHPNGGKRLGRVDESEQYGDLFNKEPLQAQSQSVCQHE